MTEATKSSNPQLRDLHGLCNRLAEVFNEDDTPEELPNEAREAIEELCEERDRLREELTVARATQMGPIQNYVGRLRAALERLTEACEHYRNDMMPGAVWDEEVDRAFAFLRGGV